MYFWHVIIQWQLAPKCILHFIPTRVQISVQVFSWFNKVNLYDIFNSERIHHISSTTHTRAYWCFSIHWCVWINFLANFTRSKILTFEIIYLQNSPTYLWRHSLISALNNVGIFTKLPFAMCNFFFNIASFLIFRFSGFSSMWQFDNGKLLCTW